MTEGKKEGYDFSSCLTVKQVVW